MKGEFFFTHLGRKCFADRSTHNYIYIQKKRLEEQHVMVYNHPNRVIFPVCGLSDLFVCSTFSELVCEGICISDMATML